MKSDNKSVIQKRIEAREYFLAYLRANHPGCFALFEHTGFMSGQRHTESVYVGIYDSREDAYKRERAFYVGNFCSIVEL